MAIAMPQGWVVRPAKEFSTMVGPFFEPPDRDPLQCGFTAEAKHGNKRGVVHGGMIATAFDAALGTAAWSAAGQKPSVTIQLSVSFIGALQMGEFAHIRTEISRATRSVVFLRGTMRAGDRVIATADGIWKVLDWRGEPFRPS